MNNLQQILAKGSLIKKDWRPKIAEEQVEATNLLPT